MSSEAQDVQGDPQAPPNAHGLSLGQCSGATRRPSGAARQEECRSASADRGGGGASEDRSQVGRGESRECPVQVGGGEEPPEERRSRGECGAEGEGSASGADAMPGEPVYIRAAFLAPSAAVAAAEVLGGAGGREGQRPAAWGSHSRGHGVPLCSYPRSRVSTGADHAAQPLLLHPVRAHLEDPIPVPTSALPSPRETGTAGPWPPSGSAREQGAARDGRPTPCGGAKEKKRS